MQYSLLSGECFMVFSPIDLRFALAPLKVGIGLGKIHFWCFSVSNLVGKRQVYVQWGAQKCQISFFSNTMVTFNGATAKLSPIREKTIKHPMLKVNIE